MTNTTTTTTIVREHSSAGPCFQLGPLVRETDQFFVYRRGTKEKRIAKRAAIHTTPCRRCDDHPESDYGSNPHWHGL